MSNTTQIMRLHTLVRNIPEINISGLDDIEIKTLTADSRLVLPGTLFVAVRGMVSDGHDYLPEAVSRGAMVLVGEGPDPDLGVPYLHVRDSRECLAQLAAAWYGNPARKLTMIGVTGTDGKTTTVNLIYHILRAAGYKVGMITTVNAVLGDRTLDTGLHVTTPDALDTQKYLAQMVNVGMTHCVLEATSHGIAQRRIAACDFDLAVVTNITHEHLDYHGSYEAYRAAKGELFTWLGEGEEKEGGPRKTAILNHSDTSYEFLKSITTVHQVTYGLEPGGDVFADALSSGADGLVFVVHGRDYDIKVRSPLIGGFNLQNCLAAFTTAVHGLGLSPESARQGISAVSSIPGRMELINMGQPFTAIIDFAHTPNALRKALETSRNLTQDRVIAVFGSAGLRDREKRRMMAEISLELADLTVITAEDPRTESLDEILEEMAAGARGMGGVEGKSFFRVPDRGEALRFAVRRAEAGDLVISCGKGHEQSMCFGEVEYPWDDRIAMRAALAELLDIDGPSMPHLPTSSK
ncbi:MAG: UDP-N-acetylmuramoyl-L-alanyl-D-glutamate--2,6-diaminopimelate ligase [Anaerolineaceae bacterium]|nr:MAG: UDP-N-acetylmuramoyl-L-alanyl-D-glutamate--2,6-diaminopimelate ligase [Anaerolineaceae bacterium]